MTPASVNPPLSNPSGSNADWPRAGRIVAALGCGVVVAGGLFVLFQFNPEHHPFFPKCGFHALTGLDCPGCGGQRALHQLLHGNFIDAFRYNALLISLAPLGLWSLVRHGARRIAGYSLPSLFSHPAWPWLLAGAVIIFGIVRNLPLGGLLH